MRTAPNGDMFLAESGAGRIRVSVPRRRLRRPRRTNGFRERSILPFGIAFGRRDRTLYVYVAETERVVRYP